MARRLRRYRSPVDLRGCGSFREGCFASQWYQGLEKGMEWLRLGLEVGGDRVIRVWAADSLEDVPKEPVLQATGRDVLLYGVRGRYLRFTVSPGEGLAGYELAFPGLSIDAALPAAMRGDIQLRRFLGVYQSLLMDLAAQRAGFVRRLDPAGEEALESLARWVGAPWAADAPEEARGKLLAAAPQLNRLRGTRRGLALLLELVAGEGAKVVEGFQWRALPLDGLERAHCARLYGDGVTVLLPPDAPAWAAGFLSKVMEEFVPVGTRWTVHTLEDGGTLDGLCFLDCNAQLWEPAASVLDQTTLEEMTLE